MSKNSIQLESLSGFHIGGSVHDLTGFPLGLQFKNEGKHVLGQMYAQHYRLAFPRCETPVSFWHGGGLTGASWETTPDGRSGWLEHFLREGFSTYLCDAFERGRASLPPPHTVGQIPEYRSVDSIWHHFRFGKDGLDPDAIFGDPRGAAYHGQQFPVESLIAFGQQFVSRFVDTDCQALAAYAAFLRRVGRCFVIGHSQGGLFAVQSATAHPHLVKAVVAIEPPMTEGALKAIELEIRAETPPHLFIFGDYISGVSKTWERFLSNTQRFREVLHRAGVPCELILLPERGIRGNSHMLQMDRNSSEIAEIVVNWLLNLDELR